MFLSIAFIFLSCVLRFSFFLTMLMCIDVQGQEDLCESFFAYNRAKGTLYDGETRLFLRGNGKHTRMAASCMSRITAAQSTAVRTRP